MRQRARRIILAFVVAIVTLSAVPAAADDGAFSPTRAAPTIEPFNVTWE